MLVNGFTALFALQCEAAIFVMSDGAMKRCRDVVFGVPLGTVLVDCRPPGSGIVCLL